MVSRVWQTDRRDCQWIYRLHSMGLLPPCSNPTTPPKRSATSSASAPTSSASPPSTSSELGCDFTKWPTVKHFTSWLGLCPNFKQTGGKLKSSATRKGKNRAAHALRLAAWGLMRSKSGLGAYLRRQRSRLGAPKAITATAHKLARIVYTVMRHGWEYVKKTEPDFHIWRKQVAFDAKKFLAS